MRKVVMYCDRCGKGFEKWNHETPELYGIGEFVFDDGDPHIDNVKDLCLSCYLELDKWWNYYTIDSKNGIKDISELGNHSQKSGSSGIKDISELGR